MLYYKVINNNHKKWVTFLHCITGDHLIFNNQIEEYSKHYNLLLIDLPAHGKSTEYKDKFFAKDVVDDIIAILNDLKISKTNIVALSLGTMITTYLLKYNKERINKIVFLGSAMGIANIFIKFAFNMFVKLKRILPRKIYLKAQIWCTIPRKCNKENRKILYSNAKKMKKECLYTWFDLLKEYFDKFDKEFLSIINDNNIYKLFIEGKHDYIFLNKVLKSISNNKYHELILFENCGHLCNLDDTKRFNNITLDFLNNNFK